MMGLALLRFFSYMVIGFLLLACIFSLYQIKGSDAYKIKDLERKGMLPPPYLDKSDSLLGPDLDGNGIRDDIDRYIKENFTQPNERKAVEQYARTIQKRLMIDTTDDMAVQNHKYVDSRAFQCVFHTFSTTYVEEGRRKRNSEKSASIIRAIHAFTINTHVRSKQFLKFNRALDGKVWSLLQGNTCNE